MHILNISVFFFGTSSGFATQRVWINPLMKPTLSSLAISLPMACRFLISKASPWLLYRLGSRVDVKVVLGEFPRYSGHVRWLPCEDISIFAQELDERAFLF